METNDITRRRVIAALGGLGAVGLAGCTDGTTGNGETSGIVKIGVLQPLTGDLKYYGQQSLWGFYEGFNHKSDGRFTAEAKTGEKTVTIGGTDYVLLVRDTQLDANRAQSLATDLVQDDSVDLLFGCASSSSATQVATTVTKQAQIPTMIGPAASASLTADSKTCSQYLFRASENTAMDARSGGAYIAKNSEVSKVYLFGADYSFGRAVVENYRTVLENNGVEIVGEKFVPQGYSEWQGLLDNAEQAGAEGIIAGFTVATLPQLFTTFLNGDYSYRVFGGFATQITVSIIGQTLQKVLGTPLTEKKLNGTGLGPFTTRYHWNQYDNEINSSFVDSYTKAYGVVPDLFSAGTFTAASAIVQAVEESGSTASDDVVSALREMTVTASPKGRDAYTFEKHNQARSAMTLANSVPSSRKNWDAPIKPSEPLARVPADRTTIPTDSSEMNCQL